MSTATPPALRLLTRGSALARWQAERVRERLEAAGVGVELVLVKSQGDRDRTTPLAALGGVGLFTKALQEELLAERGDLAVHSLKDLPSAPVAGLELAACLMRAAPEDVLLSAGGATLDQLPPGARVGTGSPRRRAQLRSRRPDLEFQELRGNLDTRRRKVLEGELDAAVLARAGLERLGWLDEHCRPLDPSWMLPAPCQGILGIECRAGSAAARVVSALDEADSRGAAGAERAFMRTLGAGCTTPVAALATRGGAGWHMVAWLAEAEAGPYHRVEGDGEDPLELGARLARELAERAGRIPGAREE